MLQKIFSRLSRSYDLAAQPISWFYEQLGVRTPKVVASRDFIVDWKDDDNPTNDISETFTIILLEQTSGRRSYKVVSYGHCERTDYHKKYMRDVMLWIHGGHLPAGFKKYNSTTEIIPFKTISARDE